MSAPQTIDGRCHCGNIRFRFARSTAATPLEVRECGCDFCQMRGGVWTSDPAGSLRIDVADHERLNRYAFGTKTADFLVCATCGVVPAVMSTIDGRQYAVVNVRAMAGLGDGDVALSTSDFSGEAVTDRLARRQKNWIADVRLRIDGQPAA